MPILIYSADPTPGGIGGIDEYTKLMLHMDGDFGDTGHDIVSFGDPNFDSTIKKFNGSVHFDGNDYLQVPDHSDWVFGTSDFTIDFWARWDTSVASAGFMGQSNGGSSNLKWAVAWNAVLAGNMTFHIQNPAGSTTNINWVWTPPAADTWYHLAIVRNGSSWYFFVDGVQTGGTQTSSIAVPDVSDPINFGSDGENWAFFTGHMDEIRISDTARWTAGFDVPTAAYTSDANTKLLIHADGDVSDSAHSISMVGDANFDNTTYKFSPSSLYLDGTGDHLVVPDSTDWDFGTEDFTIDFWVRHDAGNFVFSFEQYVSSATAWQLHIYPDFWIELQNWQSSSQICGYKFPHTPVDETWYHIALVRDNSHADKMRLAVNGTFVTPSEIQVNIGTTTWGDFAAPLKIGYNNYYVVLDGTGYHNGHIDEFRISKGIARWTSNFTPESGPYTE